MSSKKVSVIVPFYNGEKDLKKCICSLRNQKYDNLEFILIDDGSIDNSVNIAKHLIDGDNRFVIYSQSNAGVSAARNIGVSLSSGYYIIFADVDDTYEPNAIKKMISLMETENFELACFNYIIRKTLFKSKRFNLIEDKYNNAFNFDELTTFLNKVPNAPWGKVFRSDIIKNNNIKFNKSVPYGEDTIFLINYLSYINSILVSSEVVYDYKIGSVNSSASSKYYDNIHQYFNEMMKAKELYCRKKSKKYSIKKDQNLYFGECLRYRIINGKEDCIKNDAVYFNINSDISLAVSQYKRDNRHYLFKEKMKRILCRYKK